MRSIVLGNGNMLVCFDENAQVRDLYFPYVGLENHVGGHHTHRVGVFANDNLRWFDDPSWNIVVNCDNSALASNVKAVNEELGVEISFVDSVYNEKNIFLRKATVYNNSDKQREIKLYFGHEFEMYESHRGDTAYFDPLQHAIVHYNGRRVALINGLSDGKSFTDYTTGVFDMEGKEGSYKDAVNGMLSQNPIEHGLTDSVVGFYLSMGPHEKKEVYYWVAVAKTIKEAQALNEYVLDRTPSHILRTTHDFWYAWVNRYKFTFYGLGATTISLFKKSLFIIRAHTDNHGSIIASADSSMLQKGKDSYAYMWPRDGAFVSMALDRAGDINVAKRFFEFCNDVITPSGYLMHKYRPDRSLGSSWHPWVRDGKIALPIQEDETALVLYALRKHYEISKDLEFVESVYNSFIKKAADFMVEYRDEKTGLPQPSYDLWEEKYGISTFTASSVSAALDCAADFAKILGKEKSWKRYSDASLSMRDAIMKHLYDEDTGNFYKMITFTEEETIYDKTIDSSSVYGIFTFNILDINDDRLTRAMEQTEKKLWCNTDVGGMARYEDDKYYRGSADAAGNPWFITTLWLAQYYIAKAQNEDELAKAKNLLDWATDNALPSGVFSEQLDASTGKPLSATPLTWSHAAFVNTVLDYLDKLEDLGICDACDPVHR